MTYAQIITAHTALQEFGKNRLPFPVARKVFGLTKAVKTEYEFYTAEEMKLVQKYAIKNSDGRYIDPDGQLNFSTPELATEYLKTRESLLGTVCELSPVIIPASIMQGIEIAPTVLECLEGVVEFTDEE